MNYPTNRDKKLTAKKGKFWCDTCDACLVHPGGKCKNCGKRQDKRRFKK